MDANQLQSICAALQQTFGNVTMEQRTAATDFLNNISSTQPGYGLALFQISTNDKISMDVRQSAAIYLKNLATTHWHRVDGALPLLEQEKQTIRSSVLAAMMHSPTLIRLQIGELLTVVLRYDFPDKMQDLVDQCLQGLLSKDNNKIIGSLNTLRIVFKKYEFISLDNIEKRGQLSAITNQTFPVLHQILEFLLGFDNNEAGELIVLITKIFWSCTQFGVPQYFDSEDKVSVWVLTFIKVLEKKIVVPGVRSPVDLEKNPWWVAKKWVAHAFNKLLLRFSHVKMIKSDSQKRVAVFFMENLSVKLMETLLNVLGTIRRGEMVTERVAALSLNYLILCITQSTTWLKLKPHVDFIIQEIMFPILCLYDYDLECFIEDPAEYMRRQYNEIASMFSIRVGVFSFLVEVVKHRGDQFLLNLMNFLVHNVLSKYCSAPVEQRDVKAKFGCMLILSALATTLKNHPSFKPGLEDMMVIHILPELLNPNPLLRSKACVVFGSYCNMEFKNHQNFMTGLEGVLNSLKGSELSLRLEAASVLKRLLKTKAAKGPIGQVVPQLLEVLLQLMDEIDNEGLLKSLELFVDRFPEQTAQYSVGVADKLAQTFIRLVVEERNTPIENDEERENMASTQFNCIEALLTILDITQDHPDIYRQLEPIYMNVLAIGINEDSLEFMDNMIKIAVYFTYYSEKITDQMWSLFDIFYQAFMTYAADYMPDFLNYYDNVITKDTTAFFARNKLEMVFNMYSKLVSEPKTPDADAASACQLAEIVMLNAKMKLPGTLDSVIPAFLDVAINRLNSEVKTSALKVVLVEVFTNALFYNPALTLAYAESKGWTNALFAKWFELLHGEFKRLHDKRLSILAIGALLQMNFAQIPESIRAQFRNIIVAAFQVLDDCARTRQAIDAQLEEEESGEEDDEFEHGGDSSLDEEDLNNIDIDEDSIEEDGGNAVSENGPVDDSQDVNVHYDDIAEKIKQFYADADERDTFLLEEEEDWSSVVDPIDETIYFIESVQAFSQREPQTYQALMQSLTPNDQAKFQELIKRAEARRVEIAEEKRLEEEEAAKKRNNTTMQAQFPMEGTQGFADPSFFAMQQPWLKGQSSIQNLIAARTQQQPATIASPNSPPAGAHNPNSPTMHAINAMSGMNPMEQNQVNMPRATSPSHAFSGKFNFAQAEIHSDESDEVDESSGEKALANRDDISDDGKKQLSLPTKNGENGTRYLDITEHLNLPQAEAAKKLGIPTSTLSKRWKEAVRNRKWPYRAICKLDKEIMTLLHNIPQGPDAAPLPEDIETTLGYLLRKRQEELKPVVIRL